MALAARDGLTSGCNSTEGEPPHHETDRHRPSLDAVRCSRWRHLSSAHAAAAELCCRDLSHPGRLHRAQQPFSLLPLTSLRRAWQWIVIPSERHEQQNKFWSSYRRHSGPASRLHGPTSPSSLLALIQQGLKRLCPHENPSLMRVRTMT